MRVIIILLTVFWVGVASAQTAQKISYAYDDLSRLSEVNYTNGAKIVYIRAVGCFQPTFSSIFEPESRIF